MPGVSEKMIWYHSVVRIPLIRWRVVWTLGDTMASFSPIRAFNRVLLPAFGLPNMLTNPDFTIVKISTGKISGLKIVWLERCIQVYLQPTSRSRAAVARRAHNPKVGGSIPPFATKRRDFHFRRSFLFKILRGLLSVDWRSDIDGSIPPFVIRGINLHFEIFFILRHNCLISDEGGSFPLSNDRSSGSLAGFALKPGQ